MDHLSLGRLELFKNHVGIKFQLYNSLFTALPFHRIENTGVLLSLLLNHCEEGYGKGHSPIRIIEDFFERFTSVSDDHGRADLLFRFVQYVERQVVLFDALEDAAFNEVQDLNGIGTLKQLESVVLQEKAEGQLAEKLEDFAVRLVLTAHPTQFYPGSVLGIIHDLARALKENNTQQVNLYLQQLGKTPFFNKQKPTPYDEAVSLIWYLENVFYHATGRIMSFLKSQFPKAVRRHNPVIAMGFWPGGDRDGNPNVTTDTTLRVAEALRSSIIRCYYLEVRKLKRRLTFKGVDTILGALEVKLYNSTFLPEYKTLSKQEILDHLYNIRKILVERHNSLFLSILNNLINKVHVFGLHFATLDIRQESSVHNRVLEIVAQEGEGLPKNYAQLDEAGKVEVLTRASAANEPARFSDPLVRDTLESIAAIRLIQQQNGEEGCNRYIISQCQSSLNILEVFGLCLLSGWKEEELTLDIVPLFETIEDLRHAPGVMRALYGHEVYARHLQRRRKKQTIMVGFSDGTKDGGYIMANWSIYKAKEALTTLSREFGIDVIFFDGRGGPPARGGGKTHKFYASMGSNIASKELHLTIQGQTVSSNFGTVDAAQYNIEQLLNAGIMHELFADREKTMRPEQEDAIQELAEISFRAYNELKAHPEFLNYLSQVSPLNFYGETNIGSRPSKRGGAKKLELKDLRAIPFVGAWSQLKQNVPGFYGIGLALEEMERKGQLPAIRHLYQRSPYFKTLLDNSEMAMMKSFFPLTAYLADHPQFGDLWKLIHEEFERTKKYLLLLSGNGELMDDYPVDQLSIRMRERIVLPLATVQQYALARIREKDEQGIGNGERETFERLVVRTSFGIINAGRNSV